MKKIVLFWIIINLLSLTSCGNSKDSTYDKTKNQQLYSGNSDRLKSNGSENEPFEVINIPGCYHDLGWDDSEEFTSYEKSVIPDEKIAVEVATAIFKGMEKSKQAQEYVPQSVFYDEQDEIWIVSFWKDSEEHVLGGDCSIAIQKEDGKVLRIWFGE